MASFLFAKGKNPLNIIAISRFKQEARILEEGEYVKGGVTYCIRMSDERYEKYINGIASRIDCIVIEGEN